MNIAGFLENRKSYRALLSSFIAFHLLSIGVDCFRWHYSFPMPQIFSSYVDLFGLYQNWRMFENSPKANYYLCALIEKKDGSKLWTEFGHMDEQSYLQRLCLRNFRKFQQSYIFDPRYKQLYPGLCRWIIAALPEPDRATCSAVILYQKQIDLQSGTERRIPFFRHQER